MLYWLRDCSRIKFDILLWTYKTIHVQALSYLRDVVAKRKVPRPNRTCFGGTILAQPTSKIKSARDRSFQTVSPRLWNALPRELCDCQSLNLFKKSKKKTIFLRNILASRRYSIKLFLITSISFFAILNYYYISSFIL